MSCSGLVTGNVREGAEIKLGKDSIFDWFEVGGFGDDSTDRAELIRMARRRALERQLGPFESGRVFPRRRYRQRHLGCPRVRGAVAVAVATGSVPRSELAELSPDFLRDGFEPVTPFLAEVLA
jgi:phosphoglycolate phosphatase